jgi:hypothetical protein
VSSTEYFLQLLELLSVEWLRLPLLQGIATSAVAGAEGLVRASRSAMVQYINGQKAEKRGETLIGVLRDLSTVLSDNLLDDRYAIPCIEFLAFLVDGYILSMPEGTESTSVCPFRRSKQLLTSAVSAKYSPSCKKHISNRQISPDSKLQSRCTLHSRDWNPCGPTCSRSWPRCSSTRSLEYVRFLLLPFPELIRGLPFVQCAGPYLCRGIHVHGDGTGSGQAWGLEQTAKSDERRRGEFERRAVSIDGSYAGALCCMRSVSIREYS